ncbi:MAG TPA: hypothetical protein VNM15_04665, partial [Candidatus Binatia bacterium]|nr:hypothetical protein [Candidatus Binatia bacterium]
MPERAVQLGAQGFGGLKDFATDVLIVLLSNAGQDLLSSMQRLTPASAPVTEALQEARAHRANRDPGGKSQEPTDRIAHRRCSLCLAAPLEPASSPARRSR